MNVSDRVKSYFSDKAAIRIAHNRSVVAKYESVGGKAKKSKSTVRKLISSSQLPLAQQARHYEENFPLVAAMLDELAKNVVGDGIKVNPQPRLNDGTVAHDLSRQLSTLYKAFSQDGYCMDGRTKRSDAERLMFRSFARDGESFARIYLGGGHDFLTDIKLGFEPFETDHIDTGSDKNLNIHNGIKLGAYNRTEGFMFKSSPNDFSQKAVMIPNAEIIHLANKTRLNQLRGISRLAPVLASVSDLSNHIEADRLARLAAARLTVVHEVSAKNLIEDLTDEGQEAADISFEHSNVTQIPEGDKIKIIESAKGVGDVIKSVQSIQRQITTGVGVSHSSTTGTYERSYSAQRQELIDRWAGYMVLRAQLVNYVVRPSYEKFVNMAFIQGMLKLPANFNINTLYDAEFTGSVMPWIDPKKEAESIKILMSIGMLPLSLALAQRGFDAREILMTYQQDEKQKQELGLDGILAIETAMTNATGGNNAVTKNTASDDDDE